MVPARSYHPQLRSKGEGHAAAARALARTASTRIGLVVAAYLNRKGYPTGIGLDPRLISSLRLKRSNTLPK